jgi:hypothetical protein
MKPNDIKVHLRTVPFVPFYIHLDNGQSLFVAHPDHILMMGSNCVLAEQTKSGGQFRYFHLSHVSSLDMPVSNRGPRKTKRR